MVAWSVPPMAPYAASRCGRGPKALSFSTINQKEETCDKCPHLQAARAHAVAGEHSRRDQQSHRKGARNRTQHQLVQRDRDARSCGRRQGRPLAGDAEDRFHTRINSRETRHHQVAAINAFSHSLGRLRLPIARRWPAGLLRGAACRTRMAGMVRTADQRVRSLAGSARPGAAVRARPCDCSLGFRRYRGHCHPRR